MHNGSLKKDDPNSQLRDHVTKTNVQHHHYLMGGRGGGTQSKHMFLWPVFRLLVFHFKLFWNHLGAFPKKKDCIWL